MSMTTETTTPTTTPARVKQRLSTKVLYARRDGVWAAYGIVSDATGLERYLGKSVHLDLVPHAKKLGLGAVVELDADGYDAFAVRTSWVSI